MTQNAKYRGGNMYKIIAAVRNTNELKSALNSKVEIVFMLSTNIEDLKGQIELVHDRDKKIFIHIDLVDGIGKDEYGIKYVKSLGVDGIISTRVNMIRFAKKHEIHTVQRFFIVDSHSVKTTVETVKVSRPDMIEIMPGTVSKIIKNLKTELDMPIVAGGLIETKEEIAEAITSGAKAVSTGKKELWEIL